MRLPQGFSSHTTQAPGFRLHYVEGPPRDRPLVLIPGQTMPWQSYLKVLPVLSRHFHCYALDVRGHGGSEHTPGQYRFSTLGQDLVAFLQTVVRRPALLSGNSSGGVIALIAASQAPALVDAVVPEDPPLFSSEWPALSSGFVHDVFDLCVRHLDRPERDLQGFFESLVVPSQDGKRVMSFPRPLARLIAWLARRYQVRHPGQPVDLWVLPFQLRLFLKSLSAYDVGFTRAFWDGSACDIDHAAILRDVSCPILLLHADWFLHDTLGLVGAMTEEQAKRACQIAPRAEYKRVPCGHTIHIEKPRWFETFLLDFASRLPPSASSAR